MNDQGIDANGVSIVDGNLYGSSKDIGTIEGKLPLLTENGGRVDRVGFTRLELEAPSTSSVSSTSGLRRAWTSIRMTA